MRPTATGAPGRTGASPSPAIPAQELALVALAGCALAVAMFWPLVLHLGRDIPKDLGDPLAQAWQVAWGGHALLHQPLDYFQSNQFWPLRNSLAFSDALIGYAPAGVVGSGPHAAVARYDVLFLLAYALAFAGGHLLARELGAGRAGAAVAGAAFAYAPWRLEQNGHLHVISGGGIALSLFLLVRGYRSRRPVLVLAGWGVATWQFSLGFSLGLQLAYVLGVLGALAALAWWRSDPRPGLDPGLVRATLGGVALLGLAAYVLTRPYLQVLRDHPEARRTPATVATFSGPPRMFLAAPGESLVWGRATAAVRDSLAFVPEQTLFPGLSILALAVAGLGSAAFARRLRVGLGVAVVALAVLSLGFDDPGRRWLYPYGWLYELAPGWTAIRVPGRLMALTTLALALLAGAGASRALAWLRRRGGGTRAPRAAALALVALVLLEGAGFHVGARGEPLIAGPQHPTVPVAPPGQLGAPAPQLHLPLGAFDNRRYLIWSTAGFPAMVNGRSSFVPRSFRALGDAVRGFPDRASVARLQALGVRTVILHADRAAGSPWADAATRSVAGLGIERDARGALVLYRLRAASG